MRAEMVRVGAPAGVMDDEPDFKRSARRGLPRLAEEARLFAGRQSGRFADEHFRGAEAHDGRNHREHVVRRDDDQAHRSAVSLGQRETRKSSRSLGAPRRPSLRSSSTAAVSKRTLMTTTSRSPAGKRGLERRERVRIAQGHDDAARPRVDLAESAWARVCTPSMTRLRR